MIELHSHLLHDLDDGPESLADAVTLARAFVADGTHTVVATPHVSTRHPTSAAQRDARLEELRTALRAAGVALQVVGGGEVAFEKARALPDADLRDLALGLGTWVLLEAPHSVVPFDMPALVGELIERGHRPVVAHPERNPHVRDDDRLLVEAVSAGALVQVTAGSVLGRFGRRTEARAWSLLERGHAHVVSSDAHAMSWRPPELGAARRVLRRRLGEDAAAALCERVPAAVLAGAEVSDVRELLGPLQQAPRRRRLRRAR
jgi:protein-tyrosine phosphatase